ncbi:MAG: DUF2306 domain-containing protein [Gammaproteobacteria bacterium]|nr:DUF2306 domain-containing protein [Gammaproteobacteria bacterium]
MNIADNLLGHFHHLMAWISMIAGAGVLLQRKGTRRHRQWGYVFVTAMLLMNASAFGIYRLFDGFGIFHVFALVSLATLMAGMVPVLLRAPRSGWLDMHAHFMTWAYIGLLCAAASEMLSRIPAARHAWADIIRLVGLPGTDFGFTVAFASGLVACIGGALVAFYMPRALAPFKRRQEMRRTHVRSTVENLQ